MPKKATSLSPRLLAVSVTEGKYLLEPNEIIYLQASGNYTRIYLSDQRCIVSAKTLKQYEQSLSPRLFYRVRSSHLVNSSYITSLAANNEMILLQKIRIPIAKRRRSALLKWLQKNDEPSPLPKPFTLSQST